MFFELLNGSGAEVQHLWDLYLNSIPVADHRQHELFTLGLNCNFELVVLFRVWVEGQDLRDVHPRCHLAALACLALVLGDGFDGEDR